MKVLATRALPRIKEHLQVITLIAMSSRRGTRPAMSRARSDLVPIGRVV